MKWNKKGVILGRTEQELCVLQTYEQESQLHQK